MTWCTPRAAWASASATRDVSPYQETDQVADLWAFSLATYGRPGVAAACLALQDRHGLDVNILLYCCWAGRRGRALTAGELADLRAAADPWHDSVVRPLRAARRWLKEQIAADANSDERLRAEIKARELEAERLEQSILAARLVVAPDRGTPAMAHANVMRYLTALGIVPDGADRAGLESLISAGFAGPVL